jgi:hypothetical protein
MPCTTNQKPRKLKQNKNKTKQNKRHEIIQIKMEVSKEKNI